MATRNIKTSESAVDLSRQQAETFNQAMALFHQREFRRALPLFEAAAQGPASDMAYAARTHVRMCESRLAKIDPETRSFEDNYAQAIAQLNVRAYADAATLLDFSLRQQETDYAHYAAAAARGHLGQIDRAVSHLRRAIQMQPRNRALAMGDPDFSELAKLPALREVLMGN
ncbi:MAG: hypothetical protein K2X03_18340 [Bryobacteraceae bacterium]|nr:hypothetical protein [Bryobacteraceae bacterium]